MQAGRACRGERERLLHHGGDALAVDVLHREDVDPRGAHLVALPRVEVANADEHERPTGRGGPDDIDMPSGAGYVAPPELPRAERWQALPLNVEQSRNNPRLIPEALRQRALLRFADNDALFVSGLLENGGELAKRAALVEARHGKGRVLLFAINPLYRASTLGSYPLVTNAILNFDVR